MAGADPETLARGYYEAIDGGDYDRLGDLLAPGFVQVRGDQTFEGRETFVRFMREGRSSTDTTHLVDEVLLGEAGDRVAVRGRLVHADGSVGFGFVDVFDVAGGRLARLVTYTNRRVGGDGDR